MLAMLGQMYTNGGFSKIIPKMNAQFSFSFMISCKVAYMFAWLKKQKQNKQKNMYCFVQ